MKFFAIACSLFLSTAAASEFETITEIASVSRDGSHNSTITHAIKPFSNPGDRCVALLDWDWTGNDMYAIKANPSDCCTQCFNDGGCHAATWNDFEGGNCWMKKAGKTAKYYKGAIAYWSVPNNGEMYYLKSTNCDYPGNDLWSSRNTLPEYCPDQCLRNPLCVAFTWSNYEEGTCFFKSASGPCVNAPGLTSGAIFR